MVRYQVENYDYATFKLPGKSYTYNVSNGDVSSCTAQVIRGYDDQNTLGIIFMINFWPLLAYYSNSVYFVVNPNAAIGTEICADDSCNINDYSWLKASVVLSVVLYMFLLYNNRVE